MRSQGASPRASLKAEQGYILGGSARTESTAGTRQRPTEKCRSALATWLHLRKINPLSQRELFTCSISIVGLCWQVLATQPPPAIANPLPCVQDAACTAEPPGLLSQHTRWHRLPAQPAFPPHRPCRSWEHNQPGPARTTAPSWAPGTGTPPGQPHRAIKDRFHPKALPFVPKAPSLMHSNTLLFAMPPVGRGTAGLFTRDLLEKLSRLLFITSLYIHPHRVNRPHLALPRFVLAALSPEVMNKTRPDGPHPSLLMLFPWGSKLSPVLEWLH